MGSAFVGGDAHATERTDAHARTSMSVVSPSSSQLYEHVTSHTAVDEVDTCGTGTLVKILPEVSFKNVVQVWGSADCSIEITNNND